MGNEVNSSQETQLNSLHPYLDHAKRIKQEQTYQLKVTTGCDYKEYLRWKEKIEGYYPHTTLFLPKSHQFSHSNLCGSAGSAIVIYPDYPHLLHTEIYHRLEHGRDFSQPQVWYLLFTLLSAKRKAMEAGQILDDIRPKNALLNEKGMLKIPLQYSWVADLNKYQKALAKTRTYLAPEELAIIDNGNLEHAQTTEAAEMFAIGLTVLSVANLQDYQFVYDYDKIKFDSNQMEKALEQILLNNRFSQVLRSCIINLAALDPSRRMGLMELWNTLAKHSQQINSKTHFLIDNAPEKLHKEVQWLRSMIVNKKAGYPSSLPDSNHPLFSDVEPSYVDKLVPSHLEERGWSMME